MLLLIGDGGASGEGLLERLQSSLHFLSPPSRCRRRPRCLRLRRVGFLAAARADLIAEVLEDVRQQSGGLHLLAIVGCGGGAARASPSSPPASRRAGAPRDGGRRVRRGGDGRSALCPIGPVLSIHGAADEVAPLMRAQLYRAPP